MKKAIAIIDMPNSCFECPYCGWANENPDLRGCMLMEGTFFNDEQEELDTRRSMICPLKPLNHETIKDIDVQMFLEELKNEINISD